MDFLTLIKLLPEEIKRRQSKDDDLSDVFNDKLTINSSVENRLIHSKIEYPEYVCYDDDRYDELILEFNCYAFYDHGVLKGALMCDVDDEPLVILVNGFISHNPSYPFFSQRNLEIFGDFLRNT